jgi:hypothetical protein
MTQAEAVIKSLRKTLWQLDIFLKRQLLPIWRAEASGDELDNPSAGSSNDQLNRED